MWARPARAGEVVWGGHEQIARVEVFSGSEQVEELAVDDIADGEVVGERVTGIRRQLSLSVLPTRRALRWLRDPLLNLRPFLGVVIRKGEMDWVPLGSFDVVAPEVMLTQRAMVPLRGPDTWGRVQQATFLRPQPSYPGPIRSSVARLIDEVGLGVPTLVTASAWAAATPATLWERSRHQTIVDLLRSIAAEAFVDRAGQPIVQDRVSTGPATSVAHEDTLLEFPQLTVDKSGLFNVVTVGPSDTASTVQPQTVGISWPLHPAYSGRIGERVMELIKADVESEAQALAVARAELDKVSRTGRTLSYSLVPDPYLDPGDIQRVDVGDAPELVQLQSITYPLTPGPQRVTAVATARGDDDE